MERLAFAFPERRLFVRLFGADVYAVGGFVRDLIRGCPPPDVDLLVARVPLREIVRRLEAHGRVDLVGKSFGVIKFTRLGRTFDIALPRRDIPRGEAAARGHKDFLVAFDPDLPVEDDLRRRDFRCNSMALRLRGGALVDPLGGARDTKRRLIRLTDPQAFPDDPLRVLRAGRFASVLGFRVDPEVYVLAKGVSLSRLSEERVNEELFKILLDSPKPSRGLEELFRLGALEQRFPELYALTLVLQDAKFHPEADGQGHRTVWAHTKLAVDQAARLARLAGLDRPRTLVLVLAALYHDAGKAATTRWEWKRGRMAVTSCGHDLRSERLVRRAFERQKIHSWNGADLRDLVPLLIRTHHRAAELWLRRETVSKKAFNRLAAEVRGEIELVILLDAADRAGRRARAVRGLDREALWLRRRFEQLRVSRETIKPLLLGRDLLALGVAPGPEMGRLLRRLYGLQLDGAFETHAGGVAAARKLLARRKP